MCTALVSSVVAQGVKSSGPNLTTVAGKAGTTQSDIGLLVGGLIKGVLSLVGIIFLALMVYAGVLWMTARGEESKIESARNIIYAAIIGLFITVSAYAITIFVTSKFGVT